MKTNEVLGKSNVTINWQITLKVATIAAVAILLLIPKFMIIGLIDDRQKTADEAKNEVMQKWSFGQTIRGPVLTIPYIEKVYDDKQNLIREDIHDCHFLPEKLMIKGDIMPKELHRNIYKSVVYESEILLSGNFTKLQFDKLRINPSDVLWDKAEIAIAINDLRGINANVILKWGDKTLTFSPGMDNKQIGDKGVSLNLPLKGTDDFPTSFSINLQLKGSDALKFAPLGKITEVNLKSSWNDPGFQGNFLPANRDITEQGFSAYWKVLDYNRNFPQEWKDENYKINNDDFGVELVTIADHYHKSLRSAKYCILVILLMFLSFFLNEIITKQRIHPFQYILVGFALIIFYLLLLSISEQLGFNLAYLIASISVIGLVLAYSRSFLKTWANSFLLSSILGFSFLFIFILLQMENYALLVGSIGLFCILALTMFFTRKIDWYIEE
ncbi:cell envelope integrity protein CreD [Sunxiuqinia sp. A32]|uniref:cell envelope integrity protein CreD n=1 Tax=Sunxiuqinia sp. A32 TaxID=3461496 RepID=UPI00404661A3